MSNLSLTKTKCDLYFRDYYKLKINEEEYHIPTNQDSMNVNGNGKILKCNNGVNITEKDNILTIQNITKDTKCNYYKNSTEAIDSLDETENYIIFLADETEENVLNINENQKVTIDLNGHQKFGYVKNYGDINIISSKEEKGEFSSNLQPVIVFGSYKNSHINFQNIKITTPNSCLSLQDNAIAKFVNSECKSSTVQVSSAIYTKINTSLELTSSVIEGSYGIGGTGGKIIIDNSTIIGSTKAGIQINDDGNGDIILKNSTKVNANIATSIVILGAGTLTLDGTNESYPILESPNEKAISLSANTTLYYNYGETFGKNLNVMLGASIPREGKQIKNELTENGQYHMFLE